MADENEDITPTANPTAELEAKLAAVNSKIDASNDAILNQIARLQQTIATKPEPKKQDPVDDIGDIDPYSDPQKFIQKTIKASSEAAAKAVDSALQRQNADQSARQAQAQVIHRLTQDYPELNTDSSELSKLALKLHSQLPESDRLSPYATENSIRSAATQLGLLPKSMRRSEDDNFSMPGSSDYSSKPTNPGKKGKVSQDTLAVAQVLGLNIEDKAVQERLAKRSTRKYNKWG